MKRFPGDSSSLRTDRRACAIVHYKIDSTRWDYKTLNGRDVGTDCELELIEEGEWRAKKTEVQIKGTERLEKKLINSNKTISFNIKKETIRYGLNKSVPFFLFVVDALKEDVYFAELHEYFIQRPEAFEKLESDTKSMNVLIPVNYKLADKDERLIEATEKVYLGGDTRELRIAQ